VTAAFPEPPDDEARLASLTRAVLDGSGYAILSADAAGVVRTFNRAAEAMLGYTAGEVVGRLRTDDFHDPAELERDAAELGAAPGVGAATLRARRGDLPERREWTWVRKDGTRFPVRLSLSALTDQEGALTGFLGIAEDVSERTEVGLALRRATDALRESEERFRLMADAVPQIVWITDAAGRAEFFNRQWTAYTGAAFDPRDTATAADIAAAHVHPDDVGPTMAAFEQARRAGGTFRVEHRIGSATGEYRWFLVRADPYRDPETGEIVRWFGASVDIHDRRVAEDALRASEQFARRLADVAPSVLYVYDLEERRNVWGNREMFQTLGYARDDLDSLAGNLLGALLHPDDRERYAVHAARLLSLEDGESADFEYRMRHADGSWRWLHSRDMVFRRGADGRPTQIVGAALDITGRREAEEALTRQRRLYEAILDNTPDLAYVWNLDHRFIYANDGLLRMWGRTWDEAIGRNCLELGYEPWHAEMHDREIEQVVATRRPVRGLVPFTGTFGRRLYDYLLVPVLDEAGAVVAVAGTTRDVTESRQAEEALRESEARFRTLWAEAPVGISVSRLGAHLFVNPTYLAVFGHPPDTDLAGTDILDQIAPADRPLIAERVRARAAGEPVPDRYEVRMVRAEGEEFPAEVQIATLGLADGPASVCFLTDITARKRAEARDRFLLALDDAVRPLADPDEITLTAARLLGEHLRADRCAYAEVEDDEDMMNLTGNYLRAPEIRSIVGRMRFSDFGAEVLALMRADLPYVVHDIDTHEPPVGDKAAYRATQIQAVICVPLHKGGRFVGGMAVHSATPRVWHPEEVELVRLVASRCWESIERARITRDLRRGEARYRTLFESVDEGFCVIEMIFEPETGRPCDYRFIEANPAFERHTGLVGAVGRTARELVPNLDDFWFTTYGRVSLTGEPERFESHAPAMGRWFDVYAQRVGEPEERRVALLFNDITGRKRNEEELRLAALKNERIAETLQRSLLLAPAPDAYPGVTVGAVYHSAWDDAQVGGDFFDVFAVDEGRVALVVGDATGKGVEAATYTAEVKFALRAFLRAEDGAPGASLSRLSDFIADNERLDAGHGGGGDAGSRSPFVALSLVVLDTRTGAAACACAGAEPPLILRVTGGGVDEVEASGPLLGAVEGVAYEEARTVLAAGDLLVLTTDGITEARRPASGRAPRAFFGLDGLSRALRESAPAAELSEIGERVAGAARDWAGGAQHDDVCLLLARRAAGPA
jgi:PAS domain S-box-containing protein